jgi:hypothetical protein
MTFSLGRDIGSTIQHVSHIPNTALTAGGAGDNTAINGSTIQLSTLFPGNQRAESVVLLLGGRATVAATFRLQVTITLQESVDGTTWTNLATGTANVTNALVIAGVVTAADFAYEFGWDLTKVTQDRLRFVVTPDLTNAATDTANIFGVAVFGGLASRR